MIALSNNTIKKLQDQIKKEKIVFWKDETHVFLQKKKITFLYNDYESLNIHIKIMTEDGWLFEKKYKKITVNLEDDLYKKFKVRLAEKDEKMKDVISEAIKEYLRK